MACKVDISKSFDTISWDFIFRVLSAFGFPDIFINWISCIFHSAKLSILVNGTLHGYFSCSRGVRQGDPLSPILFGIAEDVLSRILTRSIEDKHMQPMVYSRREFFPSHLLYADDVVLFSQVTTANAAAIISALRRYGELSGQECNLEKSNVYFGKGVSAAAQRRLARHLRFKVGSFPMLYLGVPIFVGKPRAGHFVAVRDKIMDKFSNWYGASLSMAGRMCLVRSVIQSSIVHMMLIYKWPSKVVHDIDRACRNFIWSGNIDKKPFQAVSWPYVCSLKIYGGLGIKSFTVLNNSLLAKVSWKIIRGNEFGYNMIRHRYLTPCLTMKNVRIHSSIWMGARSMVAALNESSYCTIGSGATTLFWWDDWIGYTIADRLHIPSYMRPFLLHRVEDFYFNGLWHLTECFIINHPGIVVDILLVPMGTDEDVRYWKPSPTGEVSSKVVYEEATASSKLKVQWGDWIWAKFIPDRRSIVTWRVIRGRLPTFDGLQRTGTSGPNMCALCRCSEEYVDHVFWRCSLAMSVWSHLLQWFNLNELLFGRGHKYATRSAYSSAIFGG